MISMILVLAVGQGVAVVFCMGHIIAAVAANFIGEKTSAKQGQENSTEKGMEGLAEIGRRGCRSACDTSSVQHPERGGHSCPGPWSIGVGILFRLFDVPSQADRLRKTT